MDFIVREIDLEYEAQQRMQCGSQLAPPAAWHSHSMDSNVTREYEDDGVIVIIADKGKLKNIDEMHIRTLNGSSLSLMPQMSLSSIDKASVGEQHNNTS